MSLILEALRKSEAERQRGRAPGLFVEQRPAAKREGGVPAWAWAVAVLLVAVLVAWAWREWQRPGVVAEAATAVETTPAPATAPANAPSSPVNEPDPPVAPAIAIAPAPAAIPSSAPVEPVRTASPPAPTVFSAPPAPAPAAIPEPPPAAARSEAIGAPPANTAPFVPSLSSLAANERARLPPLKLSMHVFAETPAQRFVILDGQRLGEGASPASGLVVEEIRRDGLVLSVDGQPFLLPRP